MSPRGDREQVAVACAKCRRRKWVTPRRVGAAQCCGRPMTRAAATATVIVACTACDSRDDRLWSLGPSYICNRCGKTATAVPGGPARTQGVPRAESLGRTRGTDPVERPAETSANVLGAVTSFLRDAGIAATISGTDLVLPDGESVVVPRFRGKANTSRSINAVVARGFSTRLVLAVREHLLAPRTGLEVCHRPPSPNVEVAWRGRVVAYVSATEWKTPGPEPPTSSCQDRIGVDSGC
jgi:hypothetical protein